MASILLINGFSEDTVFIDETTPAEICDVYLFLMMSLLKINGIDVRLISLNGVEEKYKIIGKSKDDIIYLPLFTAADKTTKDISFIYTDSTASDSVAFRIATAIRQRREQADEKKVIFINQLSESDPFKSYSPMIVDNYRIYTKEESIDDIFKMAVKSAAAVVKSICAFYNKEFKNAGIIL